MIHKEELEKMLFEHKTNISQLKTLELRIESNNILVDSINFEKEIVTDNEIIEEMQLKGLNYERIVTSRTNKISNITQDTALGYEKRKTEEVKLDKIHVNSEIFTDEKKKSKIEYKVKTVKIMLEALLEGESFIIQRFYMVHKRWDKTRKDYEEEYNITLSERQAKRIRDEAIEKMLKIVNV